MKLFDILRPSFSVSDRFPKDSTFSSSSTKTTEGDGILVFIILLGEHPKVLCTFYISSFGMLGKVFNSVGGLMMHKFFRIGGVSSEVRAIASSGLQLIVSTSISGSLTCAFTIGTPTLAAS